LVVAVGKRNKNKVYETAEGRHGCPIKKSHVVPSVARNLPQ
jgi:hypothetical protein